MPGRGCLGNALDAVALLVGAIGVANIMIISVLVAARRSASRISRLAVPRHAWAAIEERRTIKDGAISIRRAAARSPRIRDCRSLTASAAMAWTGWSTVVSGGSHNSPNRIPSNPVTFTVSGMAIPDWRNSRTTPRATRSDPHTTASGRREWRSSSLAAFVPKSIENEPRSATPISRPGTRDTVSQKASKRLRPVELAVSSDTRATVLAPCPARCSSLPES